MKTEIVTEISEFRRQNYKFSLTCDEWTSNRSRRYLNINLHAHIDERNEFWNLGLMRIFGSMTSEDLVNELNQKLVGFQLILDDDIVALSSDGASVMVKVGVIITAEHQLCYLHGIHLGK